MSAGAIITLVIVLGLIAVVAAIAATVISPDSASAQVRRRTRPARP